MKAFRLALALCFFSLATTLHGGSATWNLDPASPDWNSAANWTPNTVPNGPSDTATFATADTVDISLNTKTEVDSIVFTSDASSFTITSNAGALHFSGIGISNDSGITQNLVANARYRKAVIFHNQATAGAQTVFTAENLSVIAFNDQATAGSGTFIIKGNAEFMDGASGLNFYDTSSAANGTFINGGGTGYDAEGGGTGFSGHSTAAQAIFINMPGTATPTYTSTTNFTDYSTAADSVITNKGGVLSNGVGGFTEFFGHATAANAAIVCDGGQVTGAYSGTVAFFETTSAGSATLIANGGQVTGASPGAVAFFETTSAGSATLIANGGVTYGGLIFFDDTSDGGESRVKLFANGTLDLAFYAGAELTIGSLEGDGIVLLDVHGLIIGANNLSTLFSGIIQDTGGVTKVGTGTLTLSGANTYTGGTTVTEGFLRLANRVGSATGSGAIQVNGGTLGGGGIISGAATVGSGSGPGAFLAPGTGAATLTLQSSLTFSGDGTYIWRFRTSSPKADKVIANGVTIESGAQFDALPKGNARLPLGTAFVVISNTAATAFSGTFSNLPDGSILTLGNNKLQANYAGGDGNDLTLTVVP